MSASFKILLIEDDEVDAQNIIRTAEDGIGLHAIVDWVIDWESARQEIAKNAHNVCLVDYKLGPDDGIELIRQSVDNGCKTPMILLTGFDPGLIDISAMEAGASDYLSKNNLSPQLLYKTVSYSIARQHSQRSLIDARDLLNRNNEKLVGLYNAAHEFIDNISHEFRTPLTVVKEYSSILLDGFGGDLSLEQTSYLDIIQARTDELSNMVDDMLDISRMEAGVLGVSRRNTTLGEIFDLIHVDLVHRAEFCDVNLTIENNNQEEKVFCDPDKIARAISNLGFNAIKYSGKNGCVKIWTQISDNKSHVEIKINDSRPSISTDNINFVFDNFKNPGMNIKSSTKGFGLSLNIALKLVQLNFGRVNYTCQPNSGSTFSFDIPFPNSESIIDRYIDNLFNKFGEDNSVSIFDIFLEENISENLCRIVEKLIQKNNRQHELLIPIRNGAWILCTNESQTELVEIADRYNSSLKSANSDEFGEDVPELSYHQRGTWDLLGQRSEFLQEFQDA